MHSRVIVERSAHAHDRMIRAAASIAQKTGTDLDFEMPPMKGDPAVVMMKQREIIADLLEQIDAAIPEPETADDLPEPESFDLPEPETEPKPQPKKPRRKKSEPTAETGE